MTPRERVSDERLATLLHACDAGIGQKWDADVRAFRDETGENESYVWADGHIRAVLLDLRDARRELDAVAGAWGARAGAHLARTSSAVAENERLRARLAAVEAWAARANKCLYQIAGPWDSRSVESVSVVKQMARDLSDDAVGVVGRPDVLAAYPTPGRDAPATERRITVIVEDSRAECGCWNATVAGFESRVAATGATEREAARNAVTLMFDLVERDAPATSEGGDATNAAGPPPDARDVHSEAVHVNVPAPDATGATGSVEEHRDLSPLNGPRNPASGVGLPVVGAPSSADTVGAGSPADAAADRLRQAWERASAERDAARAEAARLLRALDEAHVRLCRGATVDAHELIRAALAAASAAPETAEDKPHAE